MDGALAWPSGAAGWSVDSRRRPETVGFVAPLRTRHMNDESGRDRAGKTVLAPRGPADTPRPFGPPVRRPLPAADRPTPGWRSADIVRAVALAIVVVAGAIALWEASTVVLVVFLGVLFGLAISSGVDRLVRLHIPRGLGAVIVVVAVAWILALIGALIAPTLTEQGREIRSRLPD